MAVKEGETFQGRVKTLFQQLNLFQCTVRLIPYGSQQRDKDERKRESYKRMSTSEMSKFSHITT